MGLPSAFFERFCFNTLDAQTELAGRIISALNNL
jgi:hypothetical protein